MDKVQPKMTYKLREINENNPLEIDWVTKHTMATVLESIPEFENDPAQAHKQFSNFTFPQMRKMIVNDLPNNNHRILVVEELNTGNIVGHSIFSVKENEDGMKYGFCFTRFIAPNHRKKGLATKLLQQAEEWWEMNGARYIIAHTHVTNSKLQQLFLKFGFKKNGPHQGNGYMYYTLRKELAT